MKYNLQIVLYLCVELETLSIREPDLEIIQIQMEAYNFMWYFSVANNIEAHKITHKYMHKNNINEMHFNNN